MYDLIAQVGSPQVGLLKWKGRRQSLNFVQTSFDPPLLGVLDYQVPNFTNLPLKHTCIKNLKKWKFSKLTLTEIRNKVLKQTIQPIPTFQLKPCVKSSKKKMGSAKPPSLKTKKKENLKFYTKKFHKLGCEPNRTTKTNFS